MTQDKINQPVGIDGIAVYVPRLYVDLTKEWALSRAGSKAAMGDLVAKITTGIGVSRFSVPDAHEDSATMAAMAAARLINRLRLDPREMGYLAVGTETTVDQSKSLAAYVLGMLQLRYEVSLTHVGCPQFQFACVGATYALEAAAALIRSDELRDRYALVVATDISRYPLRGPAECTQGAGAVAMLVARNPRLLALDRSVRTTVTLDERDFFRPTWSSEAVVDGQYSINVYLSCIDASLSAVLDDGGISAGRVASSDYFVFHTPFPRMAEYAGARIYRRLSHLRAGTRWEKRDSEEERAADRSQAATPEFRDWFARKCARATAYAGQVGNIYSGALYLGLATLVEHIGGDAENCAGRTVTLFSYGSGASAKLLYGVVQPGYRSVCTAARVAAELNDQEPGLESEGRVGLTLAQYERLHCKDAVCNEGLPVIQQSVRPPRAEFALLRFGQERSKNKTDAGYRYYGYVP